MTELDITLVAQTLDRTLEQLKGLVQVVMRIEERVTRLESAMTETAAILKPKPETPDPGRYQ